MRISTRAFVIALTLVVTTAAARVSLSGEQNDRLIVAKASAFPIPSCPLDDPNACGIAGPNPNIVQK